MNQVCKELFYQRGYDIIEESDDKIVGENEDERMCLFFTDCQKFNTEKTQEYINIMNDMEISHAIIVYKESITSSAKKIIENLPSISSEDNININIELFSESELQINITKHVLQPQFERLSNADKKAFKSAFGTKFPVMLRTDAVSRFFFYRPGDVIKITRKDGYVTHRIVK